MKKLNLDVAELKVEIFETFTGEQHRIGTVRANQDCYTWSCTGTCGADPGSLLVKQEAHVQISQYPRNCCV